ncbi:hypothetical protein YC2023_043973 [Brassica napus]
MHLSKEKLTGNFILYLWLWRFGISKQKFKVKKHLNRLNKLVYGKCFEGTIPMRRTKEDDFLRASSFKRYGKKKE